MRKPTKLQQQVADVFMENLLSGEKKKSKRQIIREAGGSFGMQVAPKKVFNTEGFKVATNLAMDIVAMRYGIDKNSRLVRLAELFYNDDLRVALGAGDQITKILGEYAPTQSQIDDIRTNRKEVFKIQ